MKPRLPPMADLTVQIHPCLATPLVLRAASAGISAEELLQSILHTAVREILDSVLADPMVTLRRRDRDSAVLCARIRGRGMPRLIRQLAAPARPSDWVEKILLKSLHGDWWITAYDDNDIHPF